jgi:hypothetical protein
LFAYCVRWAVIDATKMFTGSVRDNFGRKLRQNSLYARSNSMLDEAIADVPPGH